MFLHSIFPHLYLLQPFFFFLASLSTKDSWISSVSSIHSQQDLDSSKDYLPSTMAGAGIIQHTNPKTSHPICLFINVLLLAKEFRWLVLRLLLLYMETFIPATAKLKYLRQKIQSSSQYSLVKTVTTQLQSMLLFLSLSERINWESSSQTAQIELFVMFQANKQVLSKQLEEMGIYLWESFLQTRFSASSLTSLFCTWVADSRDVRDKAKCLSQT